MNAGGRGCIACTEDLHDELLSHVRRGRSIDTAAQLLGMSGRSVHRCARRDPVFRAQLTAALEARPGGNAHGLTKYQQGCRCTLCRAGNAAAQRKRRSRARLRDAASIGAVA